MPQISNRFRDIPELFKPELQKDEKLLWSGAPEMRIFTSGDLFMIPFSLLWGGFAIFWESFVIYNFIKGGDKASGSIVLVFWGIPFVLIGLYMIFGRFFYQHWLQKNTFYAVTNKRALILITGNTRAVQSLFIDQMPGISKSVGKDGVGTLSFSAQLPMIMYNAPAGTAGTSRNRSNSQPPAFTNIKEANRVYDLLTEQQKRG